ncbi:MAG: family 10 glycosylhydrolase, partial [Phycisphaerae bacterium]
MLARTPVFYLVSALLAAFLLAGCKREEKAPPPAAPETTSETTAPEDEAQSEPATANQAEEQPPAPAGEEREPADATPRSAAPDAQPALAAIAKARKEGVRAVWVVRSAYKSPEEIAYVMQNVQDAGFNTVIFQVRGNGTVYYPSKIEPWAEQYNYQDPGFDPLAVAVKEAHSRGLAIQAWVNVLPAWRGTRPPTNPDQLYNKHPEWFWYDQNGKRQALCDFYVSLNPCLPEVRAYLVSVFREIVANYEIDALHMDYIRFPNEHPAIPRGSGLDYPRDIKTLTLYKEATGKSPDDDPAAWKKWRTDQVTQLVAEVRNMIREVRPACLLAASVGANFNSGLSHFQDSARWAEEKLIDMAFPMNYKNDLPSFVSALEPWLPRRDQVIVIPGMWPNGGPEVAKGQIQAAVAATNNFCFFAYGSMFDNRPEPAPATTGPAPEPAR